MGWGCCRRAAWVMDAWSEACIAQNNNQNTYVANGKKYFWEIGRENRDGAITGTIWKYQPGDNGLVRRSGTFRIEGNGEVERAPKFLKDCTPTQEQLDAKEEEIRRLVTEKPMFEVA